MYLFSEKTLRTQRFIVQNEYTILGKKQLILTTLLDLSVRVQPILSGFQNSSNVNSAEATSNSYNIFMLVVQYTNLLLRVGKYSFQPFIGKG